MYFNRYGHYNPVKENISDESQDAILQEDHDNSSSINRDYYSLGVGSPEKIQQSSNSGTFKNAIVKKKSSKSSKKSKSKKH